MKARRAAAAFALFGAVAACSGGGSQPGDAPHEDAGQDAPPNHDAGADAPTIDAPSIDAHADTQGADAAPFDGGAHDGVATSDAPSTDGSGVDVAPPEASQPDGPTDAGHSTPPLAPTVAAGIGHTCAIAGDGSVRCWGLNANGQLGAGSSETCGPFNYACSRTPVTVAGLAGAAQLAAGEGHSCALLASGATQCWGGNAAGQLGDGTTTDHTLPVAVATLPGIAQIAAGGLHTCALQGDGTVRCWGFDSSGQLGAAGLDTCTVSGTKSACSRAPLVVVGLGSVTELALGHAHTCALLMDGTASCWGNNAYGQLGDGTTTSRTTPAPVVGLGAAIHLTAGTFHTCALLADGTARCWGIDSLGQLGDGTTTERTTPTPVSGLTHATRLAAGAYHTCALIDDGTARCWGDDEDDRLGQTLPPGCIDGTGTDVPCAKTPVVVSSLAGAGQLAPGAYHTCALALDGSARCWGNNLYGELGIGVTSYGWTPTPVTVAGLP